MRGAPPGGGPGGRHTSPIQEDDEIRPPPERRRRSSIFEIGNRTLGDQGSSVASIGSCPSAHMMKRGPRIEYENSYKLGPDRLLDLNQIKAVCEEVLEFDLKHVKYNKVTSSVLIKRITATILTRLKSFVYERYKLVVLVTLTEKSNHGIKVASRFLWNEKTDNWVDAHYHNSTLTAQATVYGLYFE